MNLEREKKEFEKQLTIIQTQQEERNRISADMHDELGGGMTAIRLMSELAKAAHVCIVLPGNRKNISLGERSVGQDECDHLEHESR